jgi:CARDB
MFSQKSTLNFAAMLAALITLSSCSISTSNTPPQPNLTWQGSKTYTPTSVVIQVDGFGINGPLDILPRVPPVYPISIARDYVNNGAADIANSFQVKETVQRYTFVSTGTSSGFVAAAIPPVFEETTQVPPLVQGASATAIFDNMSIPACGIYREILEIDPDNIIAEANENDNEGEHFFAIPGSMTLSLKQAPPGKVAMWHAPIGGAPGFKHPVAAVGGQPTLITHTFTITATSPGTLFYYNFSKPVIGSLGSKGRFVKSAADRRAPIPVVPPAAPVAGPITLAYEVTPKSHRTIVTNILTDTGDEDIKGTVTAFTADSCFVKQEKAQIKIHHPGL